MTEIGLRYKLKVFFVFFLSLHLPLGMCHHFLIFSLYAVAFECTSLSFLAPKSGGDKRSKKKKKKGTGTLKSS